MVDSWLKSNSGVLKSAPKRINMYWIIGSNKKWYTKAIPQAQPIKGRHPETKTFSCAASTLLSSICALFKETISFSNS